MQFSSFSAILVTLAMTLQASHAAIYMTERFCQDVTHSDGTTEAICASMQVMTPSPAEVDGIVSYIGPYEVTYIYEDQYDGLEFSVEWTDPEGRRCDAYVNDLKCNRCSRRDIGGDDYIRVDCRNVPDGRRYRSLQSIAEGNMFFPLDP